MVLTTHCSTFWSSTVQSLDHTVQYARRLSMVAQQLLWEMVP